MMIHRFRTAATVLVLLCGCAGTPVVTAPNSSPGEDDVSVLARIKIIHSVCNHCEFRTNPATGKLQLAHPELPPFSIVTTKYPGKLVLSSGGPVLHRSANLSQPDIESGEVTISLAGGDNVVALRLKRGIAYHLSYYKNELNVGDTYAFADRLNIVAPGDGIAYVGDIVLDISSRPGDTFGGLDSSSYYGGRKSFVVDNEADTVGEFRKMDPALFAGLHYQKLLAR